MGQRSRRMFLMQPRRIGPIVRAAGLAVMIMTITVPPGMAASAAQRELKRAARDLRLPTESVTLARQALREVTDLVLQLPSIPPDQIYPLAQAWARLHRSQAAAQGERIFNALHSRLDQAETAEAQSLRVGLSSVIQAVSSVDPERAWSLMQRWPAGPRASDGDPDPRLASYADQMRAQTQRSVISALSACNPDRAAAMIQNVLRDSENGPAEREALLGLLHETNPELHSQLAQDALQNYKEQPFTRDNLYKQMNLLQNLSWSEPELMNSAAMDMVRRLRDSDIDGAGERPLTLRGRQGTVELNSNERAALNMIRMLRMQPNLMMQTLTEFPALADKLDQVGGLDLVLRGGSFTSSGDGSQTEDFTVDPRRSVPKGGAIYTGGFRPYPAESKLCSGQDARASQVRSQLAEIAQQENGFEQLLREAQSLSDKKPDLAEEALRLAEGRLKDEITPTMKAERLVRLAGAYADLDGEIDTNLLDRAFTAITEMSEATAQKPEEPTPGSNRTRRGSMPGIGGASSRPDYPLVLQGQLLSSLARTDLRRALDRARLLPSAQAKVAAFMQILGELAGSGYGGPYNRNFSR